MRRPILLLLAAVVISAAAVVVMVVVDPFGDEPSPEKEQPFATTPLAVSYTHLTLPTNREV